LVFVFRISAFARTADLIAVVLRWGKAERLKIKTQRALDVPTDGNVKRSMLCAFSGSAFSIWMTISIAPSSIGSTILALEIVRREDASAVSGKKELQRGP
jgi:hypothetical protein